MNRLKAKRQSAGLTQAQLAEKSGVSIRVIQSLEQGYRSINRSEALLVWRLAVGLGCDISEILEAEGNS